jgi:hypothetical protein
LGPEHLRGSHQFLLLKFVTVPVHRLVYIDLFYCGVVASGLLLLMAGISAALQRRGLSRRNSWALLICTVFLSWPVFFSVRQGNIESLLWIVVAFAVWASYRGMWWTSAILIGAVASFKLYPLIFFALFITPKKFAQVLAGMLTFVFITLGSLAYIGPNIPVAYGHIAAGIKSFADYAFAPANVDRGYLAYEHSLLSLFRIVTTGHPEYMVQMASSYLPIAAALMAVLFLGKVRTQPRLNQILVIVIAVVLLPPKSYDYTLQMLYIPWACLALLSVSAQVQGRRVAGLKAAMILLALLCSPEFFIKYRGVYSFGQFKAVCLILLLCIALRYDFADGPLIEVEPGESE